MTGRSACMCNKMGRATTPFQPSRGVLPDIGVFNVLSVLAGRGHALKMGAIVLLTAMVAAMAIPDRPVQAVAARRWFEPAGASRGGRRRHHFPRTLEVYYSPLPSTAVSCGTSASAWPTTWPSSTPTARGRATGRALVPRT